MARNKIGSFTQAKLERIAIVKSIFEEFAEYKPLTLRQVFYQLVSREVIENTKSQYIQLSGLLKYARLSGLIAWEDMEDRSRKHMTDTTYTGSLPYVIKSLDSLFQSYRIDKMHGQEKYLEVWIEKDALSTLFFQAVSPYCIPLTVCRGYSSVSFLHNFRERVIQNRKEGQEAVCLYFGDFDPSGVNMLNAMMKTIEEELGMEGVRFKRIALTPEQIEEHSLPHSPEALKEADTRAKKHIEAFGHLAVELDALSPQVLTDLIHRAIQEEIDIDKALYLQDIEAKDRELFIELRNRVGIYAHKEYRELFL